MRMWATSVVWVLGIAVFMGAAVDAGTISTGEQVIEQLRANVQRIEDLEANIVVETYKDGEIDRVQRIRLLLLQPNRMRQEYLEPDYLAGNTTLIVGNEMWIYIAAADTWYTKDLHDLSAAEQPWLVFRQFLREVEDEFDDYAFDLRDDPTEVYHLVGKPTDEAAAYGQIDLWVDRDSFVPTRRMLYDVDGQLLVDLVIRDVQETETGIHLARVIETYDERGILRSIIRYEEMQVDRGLDPTMFDPRVVLENG